MNKKSPLMRVLFSASRQILGGALLVAALLGSLSLASGQTWTATTNGTWSDSANWVGGVPATSGATVTLNGTATAVTSTIDSTWAANGSVSGLNFNMGAGTFTLASGAGVTGFSIGSGGITTNSGTVGSTFLQGPMTLTANQTWNLQGTTGIVWLNTGSVLNVGTGVTLTKTGAQSMLVVAGSSAFTGNFVHNGGQITFNTPSQYNRFDNSITFGNSIASTFVYANPTSGAAVSANYAFSDTGSNGFIITVGSVASAGSMTFNGTWSGSISHSIGVGSATGASSLNSGFSDAFTYNITGDNSALTSTLISNAFAIRNGIWGVGSSTALGTNNGLSVSIGETFDTRSGVVSGLWTNGYDVASAITTALNTSTGTSMVTIGNSKTSGVATFSGPINLTKSATATKVPTVNLVSNTGSRANFSGIIADAGTGANVSTVSIGGGGTVALSGSNTYTGDTTVIGNTTMLANSPAGSSTGTGNLTVSSGSTLGGTGFIAPGSGKTITAQSGGFIAPGDGGIGTVTLNGAGTAATLLTMSGGSSFRFDLGTANATIGTIAVGSSDLLALTGAAAGDLVFNSNDVNFGGTGTEGYYKLFSTSLGSATTWIGLTFDGTSGVVSSGLTYSGLATGLTAGSFIVGTASNGGTVGDIYFNAVPEPATWVLLAFSLTTVMILRRRQRA